MISEHLGEMRRSEFAICKTKEGKDWVLGEGSFGTVRTSASGFSRPASLSLCRPASMQTSSGLRGVAALMSRLQHVLASAQRCCVRRVLLLKQHPPWEARELLSSLRSGRTGVQGPAARH